ncbi:MAG: hypothetical protein EXR95_00580 [Gemmatimonadetes bacterium]|nr:hypothetical protein [Gemmatimonadota bacterium]
MNQKPLVRDTVRGVLLGGGVFGAVAAVQAARAGVSLVAVVQPILVFALIGLTVGGLAGPLVGRAIRRHRES